MRICGIPPGQLTGAVATNCPYRPSQLKQTMATKHSDQVNNADKSVRRKGFAQYFSKSYRRLPRQRGCCSEVQLWNSRKTSHKTSAQPDVSLCISPDLTLEIGTTPTQQIIPTGEEIWAFHVSVARDIIAETTP